MHILVTNDDGIAAPGLTALAEGLSVLGEVWVVAPDRERSATGRAITMSRPLRIHEHAARRFAVDGTPTDCVYLAVHHLLPERPGLVVSGINRGPNIGDDVSYSGTVAGAAEGALADIPAIAISRDARVHGDYAPAATVAARLGDVVLAEGLPRRVFLNVNVPAALPPQPWPFALTRQGRRQYPEEVEVRRDPRGQPYYWIGGSSAGTWEDLPGSDANALAAGTISITPLQLDQTSPAQLDVLAGWSLDGCERVG